MNSKWLLGGILTILIFGGGAYYTLKTRQLRQVYIPFITPILNRTGLQPIYSRKLEGATYEQVINIPQYSGVKVEKFFEGEIVSVNREKGAIRGIEIKKGNIRQQIEFLRGGPVIVFDKDGKVIDEHSLLEGMKVRAYFTEREERFISRKVYIL